MIRVKLIALSLAVAFGCVALTAGCTDSGAGGSGFELPYKVIIDRAAGQDLLLLAGTK